MTSSRRTSHVINRLSHHARFSDFAKWTSNKTGHPLAFAIALAVVISWLLTGPIYHYSDTWQLIINTGTTIVTFLMVFLVQNAQNRDAAAIQIKLDELIRVTEGAHNALLEIEELSYEELDAIRARYELLAARARAELERGARDTDTPEVEESPPGSKSQIRKRAS